MKTTLYTLLLGASLAGCQDHSVTPAAEASAANALVGTWRLTDQQVMVRGPVLNEILVFDNGQDFRIFRSRQLSAQGTYSLSRGPACGETTDRDQLKFTAAAPSGAYTVQGSTLTIDQTNRCISDTGIYTYERVP